MKNTYTVRDIAKESERRIETIYYHIRKQNIKPIKSELIKGNAYTNFYSEGQKTTILGSIEEVEKNQARNPPKSIPEIIYVTRTTEILHSKLNFLTLEQL